MAESSQSHETRAELEAYLNTSVISSWESIVTLIFFVGTNIIVLFPFTIPIYVPRKLWIACLKGLGRLRIIAPPTADADVPWSSWKRLNFPMNFITAPLIADLLLLAMSAIGQPEVYGGIIGADNIDPLDIMVFFLTLAYIAISIDASGLIRYLAFRVLQWGGEVGHRLFFYLYAFFFVLGSFIGNDPIILSGTAFLAYMTRVSSNIVHPRAWIYTQFAVANIASAILVSSNPTNLVLAGAFKIKFIDYTANMVVPVVLTAIILFPFLLYIVFADPDLIPQKIQMHELPEEARRKKPVNPNIPNARGKAQETEDDPASGEEGKLLSLEEIMNPFLDKGGAAFGAVVMATALITLLALNASKSSTDNRHQPVYWVTLPCAFVMFCWDLGFGWLHRHETRSIARKGRQEVEEAHAEHEATSEKGEQAVTTLPPPADVGLLQPARADNLTASASSSTDEKVGHGSDGGDGAPASSGRSEADESGVPERRPSGVRRPDKQPATLVSLCRDRWRWAQETFSTASAVLAHLPWALVPFAFTMFILVQALATKGWVPVFAYGWDHWVEKTGTIGAVGGMGFLSVILCNFAGTNIGTTILLSRVIQAWQKIHVLNEQPISDRTFWATVYSMALGVNFGAFSAAFSASLAGLLWRDILARKHIRVRELEFARVNLPIIAIAMVVGSAALIGEVYIYRKETPYSM